MNAPQPDFYDVLRRGIERCRRGDWDTGLAFLGRVAEADHASALPGLFYSYLGYGIAMRQKRVQEGLKLLEQNPVKRVGRPAPLDRASKANP